MPRPLVNRPTLKPKDLPYREAFLSLHGGRQSGASGPNPIPVSEVLAYLELGGIANFYVRSKYLRLVQQMDAVYFKHLADNQPKPPST